MTALTTALVLASMMAPSEAPPIQRPSSLAPDEAAPAPAEPAPPPVDEAPPATDVAAEPSPTPVEPEPAPPDVAAEPEPAAAEPEPIGPVAVEPNEAASADTVAEPGDAELLRVATERDGPPYYVESDLAELRERYDVEANPAPPPPAARWRCLIADPTCRHTFEIQTMGAYALRARQGDVSGETVDRWHSARAQYDFWASLPALVETEGKTSYTRMSLGPKGGVAFSDTGDVWGNLGIAARYWLGRGRWAPNIEITSALSFKLGSRVSSDIEEEKFRLQRGPVGFTADVGFGLGGFGAIVIGGQYDSPLAREDVPEEFRVVSSGMFYVGFRGNILWGGPAVAAVASHASTRAAQRP
ncbi:MAG: hypothetical protein K0V04_03310 [Deltaproteobacteria bacterium]|nr:hypothetical protein [Deltaproteobacteria bacterium]